MPELPQTYEQQVEEYEAASLAPEPDEQGAMTPEEVAELGPVDPADRYVDDESYGQQEPGGTEADKPVALAAEEFPGRGLVPGRIVHYVISDTGEVRAAMVVRSWASATTPARDVMANLEVHLDGDNDRQYLPLPGGYELSPSVWRVTSAHFSPGHAKGTWHYPARS